MADIRTKRSYRELEADPLYKEYALPDIPETKNFGKHHGFNRCLRHLLTAGDQAAVEHKWDDETKSQELYEAICVLCDIRYAMYPDPDTTAPAEQRLDWEKSRRQLWWHRDEQIAFIEGRTSRHGHHISKELLLNAVGKYLKRPWMQDRILDWLLCDALVFFETYGVACLLKEEALKANLGDSFESIFTVAAWNGSWSEIELRNAKLRLRKLRNVLLLYVGVPLAVYAGLRFFNETQLANLVGVLASAGLVLAFILDKVLAQFFPYRYQRVSVQVLEDLWSQMSTAYASLIRFPLNPGLIKATLLAATPKGAVWDGAVFALLERAIQQDPIVWDCMED